MNRERAVQKRKYFGYRGFGYIVKGCRVKEAKEVVILQSSNKFKSVGKQSDEYRRKKWKGSKKGQKNSVKRKRVKEKKERLVEVRKAKEKNR